MKHVLEAQQWDRERLEKLFVLAREMKEDIKARGPRLRRHRRCLDGFVMASLFYEPSTRTRFSHEAAMLRLGGEVLSTENAREFSSAAKGETLEDSIRVVSGYADVIVMRHNVEGAAKRAAAASSVPVINAGDGAGQHPTQALLDLFTITDELGGIDGKRIVFVGDLANGRTVRSLAYLLGKFKPAMLTFVAHEYVRMHDDIKQYLARHGVPFEETEDLSAVASEADVLYVTRIQKERFGDRIVEYEAAFGRYVIDQGVMMILPPRAIVMHPLPRVNEIRVQVDDDPRAAYFRQAENGLYVRMALLHEILNPECR